MQNPAFVMSIVCLLIGFLVGKKNPVVGGAFMAVALIALLWAPGGLIVAP